MSGSDIGLLHQLQAVNTTDDVLGHLWAVKRKANIFSQRVLQIRIESLYDLASTNDRTGSI